MQQGFKQRRCLAARRRADDASLTVYIYLGLEGAQFNLLLLAEVLEAARSTRLTRRNRRSLGEWVDGHYENLRIA